MNARSTISSKGQLVVPKSVRDAEGWVPGTEVEFVRQNGEVVVRPVRAHDPRFPRVTWEELRKRRIVYNGPPISIEDMDKAILDEAAKRWHAKNS